MICLSYYEAYNEKSRIEKQGGRAVMKKRWYGWSVTEWISQEIDQMSIEILDQIYDEMDKQGEDKDVHLAIEIVSIEIGEPQEDLLKIYDRCF